jgi:hypothetical protein
MKIDHEMSSKQLKSSHLSKRREEPKSLGPLVMKGLSEDIEGDISFEVNNGTRISIIFEPCCLE